jgi:hypothetical protein
MVSPTVRFREESTMSLCNGSGVLEMMKGEGDDGQKEKRKGSDVGENEAARKGGGVRGDRQTDDRSGHIVQHSGKHNAYFQGMLFKNLSNREDHINLL